MEGLIQRAHRHLHAPVVGQQVAHPMPGVLLLGHDAPTSFEATVYEPVMCLILQGRKQVSIGEQSFSFGPGECLIVSHDLPVLSRITRAPYTALILAIDIAIVRKLYDQLEDAVIEADPASAAGTHRADPELIDAMSRYLALADSPRDAKVLGPLLTTEIHYRLLASPHGGMLRRLIRHDSIASAIARAIAHIRADLRSPITIPDLARRVGMSGSSFHKHFKTITATTPLQYQKELRLLEARRLLSTNGASVATAAFDVGYESPSQFSREYARKFGAPPGQRRREGVEMHGSQPR